MSENAESMIIIVSRTGETDVVSMRFKYKGKLYGTQVPIKNRRERTLRKALGLILGVALDMMRALDEQADEGAGDLG